MSYRGSLAPMGESGEIRPSLAERDAAARATLAHAEELRRDLLHSVSHEIRTPLTAVLGYARTLRSLEDGSRSLPAEERSSMLDALVHRAEALEGLLAELLDVDRLERGLTEARRRTTDMKMLGSRVVRSIDFGGRGVEVDLAPTIVSVDVGKVERMLEEMLVNAVRHTPAGCRLRMSGESVGRGFLIVVEDDGAGVAPEDRERIFEPLTHGSEGIGPNPGAGLGLAYVKGVAELHGGTAWVEDSSMGGARFCVLLPGPAADATVTRGSNA